MEREGGGSWCEVLDAGRLETVSALAYPVYLAYLGKVIKFGKRRAAAGSVSLKSLRLCFPPGFLSVSVRYLTPPPPPPLLLFPPPSAYHFSQSQNRRACRDTVRYAIRNKADKGAQSG